MPHPEESDPDLVDSFGGASGQEPLKPPQVDQWCLVKGSSWEACRMSKQKQAERSEEDHDSGEAFGPNADLVGAAFRQIKYELFCASVDLLGYSLEILPNRNCLVRSSYSIGEDSEANAAFEFVYDHNSHKYTDLVWADHLQQYAELCQYWILERQSIPGFLAEVFLRSYNLKGTPPCRPRN